jgi:hypothetical protein
MPVSGYDIIINGVPRTFRDIAHVAIQVGMRAKPLSGVWS